MKNSKACLFLVLYLIVFFSSAQSDFNLSGRWNGTIQVPLGEDLLAEYNITQSGLHVTGYVKSKTINGKDSSKHTFSGSIKQGVIQVKGTKFEYKTAFACLAVSELSYIKQNSQEKLIGK